MGKSTNLGKKDNNVKRLTKKVMTSISFQLFVN